MPTKNILKTNLYEKGIWREISPQKIFQDFFRPTPGLLLRKSKSVAMM